VSDKPILQSPTGLADGLEVGVLYQRSRLDAPQRVCVHARVGPPYRFAGRSDLGDILIMRERRSLNAQTGEYL